MKIRHTIRAMSIVLAASAAAATQQAALAAEDGDNAAKIVALLQQRREVLRQLLKLAEDQYGAGQGTFDSVLRASNELTTVDLELAKDQETRLAIYRHRVELLKNAEKMATAQFRAGQAPQQDVLGAKAELLGTRVELLRQQKTKP